ncbi:MAG TPA: hypothetical protein VN029_05270 [Sphingomonas sp.]|nr:hypothetical protein [Sphingomonas sp.]
MTRVGNVDQVLLLLREQLQRAGRTRGVTAKSRAREAEASTARPLDRVRALAALDTLEEEDLRRAVVRGLLAEQFGEAVGNDPALIAIVDQVSRIIGETAEGRELMDRALAQLKESRP